AGDEVAVHVHEALRALGVKHRQGRVAEAGLDDGGRAAVDVLGVGPDVGHDLGGVGHFRAGELERALDPGVVVLRGGGAQQDVLDPVGGHPAGGGGGLDADAPGGRAVLDHLVHQGLELV